MTVSEAKQLASKHLYDHPGPIQRELLIDDAHTVETETAFVFFYQHRNWVLHRDANAKVMGNHPIEVNKQTKVTRNLGFDHLRVLRAQLEAGDARRVNEQ